MKKSILIVIFVIFTIFTSLSALADGLIECKIPNVKDSFSITERFISFTDTFDVESAGENLGTISEKFISLTKSFIYLDSQGNLVATARKKIFSWGTEVDVFDCNEQFIGSFKEQVFKSLFKFTTTYSVMDANKQTIAESDKMDWIGTSFNVLDLNRKPLVTFNRPWFNLVDHWTGTVFDPTKIDMRIIVMMATYKSSVDNDRRHKK